MAATGSAIRSAKRTSPYTPAASRRRAGGPRVLSASPNIAPMSADSPSRSTASVRSHWTIAVVLTVDGMVRAGSRWVRITQASG